MACDQPCCYCCCFCTRMTSLLDSDPNTFFTQGGGSRSRCCNTPAPPPPSTALPWPFSTPRTRSRSSPARLVRDLIDRKEKSMGPFSSWFFSSLSTGAQHMQACHAPPHAVGCLVNLERTTQASGTQQLPPAPFLTPHDLSFLLWHIAHAGAGHAQAEQLGIDESRECGPAHAAGKGRGW